MRVGGTVRTAVVLVSAALIGSCRDAFAPPADLVVTLEPARAWPDTLRVASLTSADLDIVTADGARLEGLTLQWSTTDSSVLRVSPPLPADAPASVRARDGQRALVTAHRAGTATLIARLDEPGFVATELRLPVVVAQGDWPVQLTVGDRPVTSFARVALDPSLGDVEATWTSNDPSRVAIEPAGAEASRIIAARASGVAAITIALTAPRIGRLEVTTAVSVDPVQVAATTAWPTTLTVGDKPSIAVQVRDRAGVVITRPVVWRSNNTAVLTVDSVGGLIAFRDGTAEVSAIVGGGSLEATEYRREVKVVVPRVIASPEWPAILPIGGQAMLTTVVLGANDALIAAPTVRWSSTNLSAFTVDATGRVSALSRGGGELVARVGDPPFQTAELRLPMQVVERWSAVSAGFKHTCAIAASDGSGYCWGSNQWGALGIAIEESGLRTRPSRVATSHRFTEIAAAGVPGDFGDFGESHTCGREGITTLLCWGSRANGQLGDGAGDGTFSPLSNPSPVAIVENGRMGARLVQVRALATGGRLTCIEEQVDDPFVICWGMARTPPYLPDQASAGLEEFRSYQVTAGGSHACALTEWNPMTVHCIGLNTYGQLGVPSLTQSTTYTRVVDATGNDDLRLSSPVAGGKHVCAIQDSGLVWCWGSNSRGQLGYTTSQTCSAEACSRVAQAMTLGFVPVAITAGWEHTCALAPDGAAWCWGSNTFGQLGRGAGAAGGSTPARVVGGLTFASLSAGGEHTCAVTTDGAMYCWGRNHRGQLGDGTQTDRAAPARVVEAP